jgi:hypothetical protein
MAPTLVHIRVGGADELAKARAVVREAGGRVVEEFDGLLAAEVPAGDVAPRLAAAGLTCTFPEGTPGAPAPRDDPALFRHSLKGLLATHAGVLAGLADRVRQVGLNPEGTQLHLLAAARVDPAPILDGFDIEGLSGGLERLLPAAEELLPEDAYLVRVAGPLRPPWREELARFGEIGDHHPPDTFRMVLTPGQLEQVRALPFVRAVKRYGLLDTLTPALLELLEGADPARPAQFDLTVHRAADRDRVEHLIEFVPGVRVVSRGAAALRLEMTAGSGLVAALAHLPFVRSLAPYVAPRLFVDQARRLLGVEAINAAAAGGAGERWTGRGEVVALFDSGVDATHPDLAPALAPPPAAHGAGRPDDHVGHGTHVAGIIAGRGIASGGAVRGVAPEARLYSVGIVDAANKLDVPPDLGDLLKLAVDAGAKIINLSWGVKLHPDYDVYGHSIDRFLRDNPEVLAVVAVGNEGEAPGGWHKPRTLGMPAGAKNVLTVGACGNDRPAYTSTWGQVPGAPFPEPPARDERVAGVTDFPAAISSRGPTAFSSVKPDLLAPGTLVLSARAATASVAYVAYPAPSDRYAYLNGTSMAAPAVAGAAAVVRQYLREVRGAPRPSAALLKALLVLAAVRLPDANRNSRLCAARYPELGFPDFDQGFGRLDLRTLLPHPAAPPDRVLAFADVANDAPEALQAFQPPGAARRSTRTYRVRVPDPTAPPTPLRAVLAWTDTPGRFVQNGLSLRVVGPDFRPVFGNEGHRYNADPARLDAGEPAIDRFNNVLAVAFPDPLPGEYRLTVLAESTPVLPQGYALAVGGPLAADALEVLT